MQTDYIDLITINELCGLLMIGRTTAYNLLRSGEPSSAASSLKSQAGQCCTI